MRDCAVAALCNQKFILMPCSCSFYSLRNTKVYKENREGARPVLATLLPYHTFSTVCSGGWITALEKAWKNRHMLPRACSTLWQCGSPGTAVLHCSLHKVMPEGHRPRCLFHLASECMVDSPILSNGLSCCKHYLRGRFRWYQLFTCFYS